MLVVAGALFNHDVIPCRIATTLLCGLTSELHTIVRVMVSLVDVFGARWYMP
jgi:hypothetical protein